MRQCLVVSPSGMASHSSSSESQSLRLSWRVLIRGKVRVRLLSWAGDGPGACRVGSPDEPRFPTALTTSSMESVASVFLEMQLDRSMGVHTLELGAM